MSRADRRRMERNSWNAFVERIVPGIHYYSEGKCIVDNCNNQAEIGQFMFSSDATYHRYVLCNTCWENAGTSNEPLNISIIELMEAVNERGGSVSVWHHSSGYKENGEKNIPSQRQLRNSFGIIDHIIRIMMNGDSYPCPDCNGTGISK